MYLNINIFSSRWPSEVKIPLPGEGRPPLQLSTGRLAKLADGAAVATLGGTAVMATVCRGKAGGGQSFLPMTVDYRQKAAAAGRIPANFLRRELGPSEKEVLTSRLVDRSLRPLAVKGFHEEVGIVILDHHHDHHHHDFHHHLLHDHHPLHDTRGGTMYRFCPRIVVL